jgi:hypothetical protein
MLKLQEMIVLKTVEMEKPRGLIRLVKRPEKKWSLLQKITTLNAKG